jgi:hypothetical protein
MGKSQRDKGARYEREIVNLFRSIGMDASRVPLSGMGHEKKESAEFAGDIVLPWLRGREKFEAKKRGSGGGFALIYRWLSRHKGLFIGADRVESLVVLRLSDFVELYQAAHSDDQKWDKLPEEPDEDHLPLKPKIIGVRRSRSSPSSSLPRRASGSTSKLNSP